MKNGFIKTTLILIIGGFITKLLTLLIKVVMTRAISTHALGLYMMITPTLMLIINLASAGFPTAISKLVSDENYNNKKLLFSILPLIIFINILIMIIIFIIAPYLSRHLLKNRTLYLGIISIALVIPFTSISSIIRSYFFGKSNAFPLTLANILECVVKLIIYYFYLPIIKNKSLSYIVCFLVLSNIISEITSIFTMMFFLPTNINIRKKDFIPKLNYIRSSLVISIPNTTSTLIGSIGYFLEPIILTSTLKYVGYSTSYITYNYGIITGYVIPLILMPSFFTLAISQALLPNISKEYSKGNIKTVKRKLKLAVLFTLLIGFIFTFIFVSVPKLLLRLIFHTEKGVNILRILSLVFFIHYLESPLTTTLEAIGKSATNMKIAFIGTIVRTISLFIFSLFRIGLWSLIIADALNIFVTIGYLIFNVDKSLSNYT